MVRGAIVRHARACRIFNSDRQGGDDALSDVVLNRDDVIEFPAVVLGPDTPAVRGIKQLGGDANFACRRPDASLEHVTHAEFAPDLLDRDATVAIGRVGDDE